MNGATHNLEVLWCADGPRCQNDGWSFPGAIERTLQGLTEGLSVLQLFGGKASWGVRLDIDPMVAPDVIADAWLPPFKRESFDAVILNPPYIHLEYNQMLALTTVANWMARKLVIWLHTLWIDASPVLRYQRGWLVRVGNRSVVRCIEVFEPTPDKRPGLSYADRGPLVRYNRWLGGQYKLL